MAGNSSTLYWHDYETTGTDPVRDRPLQFAGVRTDLELNIIGEPLSLYCRPAEDVLPQPEACLVTGITPQEAREKGVIEAEFIRQVHEQLAMPGTCGVGYNSIRFDDEVTRNTLYRNFYDPYGREWQNGNSRWDIIDMVRLTYALRPQGIEWPMREENIPSFRLEELSAANGIQHEAAHDALSDVYATIALARLIRKRQPRLYEYVFEHRAKRRVLQQLNVQAMNPVLHVSGMYPGEYGRIAVVAPLAMHPSNQNEIIVYDLRYDPAPLLELSAQKIAERVFTSADQLSEGVERIPLKTVRANKCPVIVPLITMDKAAAKRLHIDLQASLRHLDRIKGALASGVNLTSKLQQVFGGREFARVEDPDLSLYGGGFFSNADRNTMERLRAMEPEALQQDAFSFQDRRLPEMLFRYRARNYPHTLSAEERARWQEYRRERLTLAEGGGSLTLEEYMSRVEELSGQEGLPERNRQLLEALRTYGNEIRQGLQ